VTTLAERIAERIARHGPIPFSAFMDTALYDDAAGFYASGGHAGRRGDFLTSVEVGPLFGAVVARALDTWWDELGRPDPYVVVDAGAGPGTLARTVLAARPRCAEALRLVLVERSAAQRARHSEGLPLVPAAEAFIGDDDDETGPTRTEGEVLEPPSRGPLVVSLAELPIGPFTGIVIANELLDNLAFDVLVHDGSWRTALVGADDGGRLTEITVPATSVPAGLPDDVDLGARVPVALGASRWVTDVIGRLQRGRLVVLDYTASTAELAHRPWRDWLRTYRANERGRHPLRDPGTQDITADVPLDQLPTPTTVTTQAVWLERHGIEALVEEGRRTWAVRAGIADLAAMKARSRVREAEALLDPDGLGGFTVAEWVVDDRPAPKPAPQPAPAGAPQPAALPGRPPGVDRLGG
jgi:SAM-dependent MidA family methyltransferase